MDKRHAIVSIIIATMVGFLGFRLEIVAESIFGIATYIILIVEVLVIQLSYQKKDFSALLLLEGLMLAFVLSLAIGISCVSTAPCWPQAMTGIAIFASIAAADVMIKSLFTLFPRKKRSAKK